MKYLCFDLETAPIADAGTYVEPASAPSNYKDAEKIAAYIAQAEADAVAKCSLDPDLCRIVALGWADEAGAAVHLSTTEQDETYGLTEFFRRAEGRQLVGYNCLSFDLPVLLRRALYLGVKAPQIQIDKFRHPDVIDLMTWLSFNGAIKAHSLSFYTHRFGLPSQQDDVTGADIGRLVSEDKWDQVKQHCLADVLRTQALAVRVGAIPALATADPFARFEGVA